jgi:DNA-binding transcriptional LysR family regulator
MAANSPQILLEAAKRGLGIALVPGSIARAAIAAGEVFAVLAEGVGADVQLSVLYLDREFVPKAVKAFVAYVSAWAKREHF